MFEQIVAHKSGGNFLPTSDIQRKIGTGPM